MKKPIHFELHQEDIADFFFGELISLGYSPTEDELEDIADIAFDYMAQALAQMGYEVELYEEDDE